MVWKFRICDVGKLVFEDECGMDVEGSVGVFGWGKGGVGGVE